MLSQQTLTVFEQFNGTLPVKIAKQFNISGEALRKAFKRGDIEKGNRGVYVLPESFYDDYFGIQSIYTKGIYSHESALLLHNYTTFSSFQYNMTFPFGYHTKSLKDHHIVPFFSKEKFYKIGLCEMKTFLGNSVWAYDKERTILDMFSKETHDYLLEEIIVEYAYDEEKDLDKLRYYGELMNKDSVVRRILRDVERAKK